MGRVELLFSVLFVFGGLGVRTSLLGYLFSILLQVFVE